MTQEFDITRLNLLVKGKIPDCNMSLENTLKACYAADYHEEYHSQGFLLMLMIDEQYQDNPRKYFWKIVGPSGKQYGLPELEFRQHFTYRKPTYSQFQIMVQIIKAGERI